MPARLRAVIVAGVLLLASGPAYATSPDQASDIEVKAALIFNFAKFTDWPEIAPADPIVICVLGDEPVARGLGELTRGETIGRHAVEVRAIASANGKACHVLFVSAHAGSFADTLGLFRDAPTLTVSDANRFAASGGVIELFVASGRMRFAVNVDAAERSHLKLSSHLLGLAKIVKDVHAQ
jgi:uncharacterized protein DUF4154